MSEKAKFRVVRNFGAGNALSEQKSYRVESVELMIENEAETLAEALNGESLNRYKNVFREQDVRIVNEEDYRARVTSEELNKIIKKYGHGDPEMITWLKAQCVVIDE